MLGVLVDSNGIAIDRVEACEMEGVGFPKHAIYLPEGRVFRLASFASDTQIAMYVEAYFIDRSFPSSVVHDTLRAMVEGT